MTKCEGCGVEFSPATARQRFHSDSCRTRSWRRGSVSRNGNVETMAGANRDRVVVIAEGFGAASDVDAAVLEAALSLAAQVDRDPANAMLWSQYQRALSALQAAVRSSQEETLQFEKLKDDLEVRALLLARDRVHYGDGLWLGGDRRERFRPFVEAALVELDPSWRALWERDLWDVYPLGDDRCQIVLGSLPLCSVELSDVGLDSGGRALGTLNGKRRER